MKTKRKLLLILIDSLIIISSYIFISALVNIQNYAQVYTKTLLCLPLLLLSYVVFSYLFKLYRIIWRYAESFDYIKITFALLCSFAVVILYDSFLIHTPESININLFSCSVSILSLIFIRLVYVLFSRGKIKKKVFVSDKKKALIIGAGYTGKVILSELFMDNSIFEPIGFVDDDASKANRSIEGLYIVGCTEDIPRICNEKNIDTLIFAIPSCDDLNRQRILNICMTTECELKIIPYISHIVESAELLSKMRDVKIEDLLGRAPISLENSEAESYIRNKVCMVTGGGGSIGSELCRQISCYNPKKLIVVDVYENNAYELQQELKQKHGKALDLNIEIACVTDQMKMQHLFDTYKVDIIVHAAAHKHVPLMETNPEEAIKNNVCGTLNLVKLADANKVKKFILISSDKAVNPTNVMGASKRLCEKILCTYAQKSKTEFASVRFGNVLGSNGSVIPLFKQQINAGGPITITHPDIIRYFMTIPEAVSLVLKAGAIAKGGEIFILDMGKPVKIVDLAEKLIKLSGFEPYQDIKIEFVGLRPGEKLFEELLLSGENIKDTTNDKIFIGEQSEFDYDEFTQDLEVLIDFAIKNDKKMIIEKIKEMLPNFNHLVCKN